MDNFPDQQPRVPPAMTRILILLAVLLVPIVGLVVVFTPLAGKKNAQYLDQYMLPKIFDGAAVDSVVQNMRGEQEFSFYFAVLSEERINRLKGDVILALGRAGTQKDHYQLVSDLQGKVRSMAALFRNLPDSEHFEEYLRENPELNKDVWTFCEADFKLTVTALTYKATYDRAFQLKWDEATRVVAGRLRRVLVQTVAKQ